MDHYSLTRCQRCPVYRPLKKANNTNVGGLRTGWAPAPVRAPVPTSRVGRGLHAAAPPFVQPEEDDAIHPGGISDSDDIVERPRSGNLKPIRYYGGSAVAKATEVSNHLILYAFFLLPRCRHALLRKSQ
jgi:hypothetical protein